MLSFANPARFWPNAKEEVFQRYHRWQIIKTTKAVSRTQTASRTHKARLCQDSELHAVVSKSCTLFGPTKCAPEVPRVADKNKKRPCREHRLHQRHMSSRASLTQKKQVRQAAYFDVAKRLTRGPERKAFKISTFNVTPKESRMSSLRRQDFKGEVMSWRARTQSSCMQAWGKKQGD